MTAPLSTFSNIHAHALTGSDIVTSVEPGHELDTPYGEAWYSIGIHPWSTAAPLPDGIFDTLEREVSDSRVVAIGECGLDKKCGGPAEVQEEVFLRQARLAEKTGKPLIIHCVGRYGRLLELHRLVKPTQLWIVHGFTGKAELARQLVAEGFGISLGLRSDPSLEEMLPAGRVFHETD